MSGFRIISASRNGGSPELAARQRTSCALPEGFRFLVTDAMEVVEPVLLYLRKYVAGKKPWRLVTLTERAACDDLYEWFHYLELIDLHWAKLDLSDIRVYRTRLENAVSPRTLRPYARNTIRRRLGNIVSFHKWATEQGLAEFFDPEPSEQPPGSIDSNPLVHLETGAVRFAGSDVIPGQDPTAPSPFYSYAHLHKVLLALGPRPDAGNRDSRPTRNRLAAMFSMATGVRISEVVAITLADILSLQRHSSNDPISNAVMWLRVAKGARGREIQVPTWLLDDLLIYADTERRAVVERAKSLGRSAAPNFFLNGCGSSDRDVGRALTDRSLSRSFREAVLSAGFFDRIGADSNGTSMTRMVARHTFHDLRHTFAVQQYFGRTARGDAEPWKDIATALGHRSWKTTMDYYMPSVTIAGSNMSDLMSDFIGGLHSLDRKVGRGG